MTDVSIYTRIKLFYWHLTSTKLLKIPFHFTNKKSPAFARDFLNKLLFLNALLHRAHRAPAERFEG